jgi:hypothetical protein
MSLKKVASLYPGGQKDKEQAGGYTYSVVREVGGLSTAYLMFRFDSGRKLNEVAILFPAQGTEVNLKTGDLTLPLEEDAGSMHDTLKRGLAAKYGDPLKLTCEGCDPSGTTWLTKGGDLVILARSIGSDGYKMRKIGLSYRKMADVKVVPNGL